MNGFGPTPFIDIYIDPRPALAPSLAEVGLKRMRAGCHALVENICGFYARLLRAASTLRRVSSYSCSLYACKRSLLLIRYDDDIYAMHDMMMIFLLNFYPQFPLYK